MKKIATLCILISWLISCDSLLDIKPTTQWSADNYPTEEAHLKALIYGGYDRLQTAVGNFFPFYGDARSDAYTYRQQDKTIQIQRITTNRLSADMLLANWSNFYQIIKQANLVIKYTPIIKESKGMTNASANKLLGQAHGIRALAYFYIVRIWGDAPIILEPYEDVSEYLALGRSSVDTIINEVIHPDLELAATLIPSSADNVKTEFSAIAANAFRAHVYAWQHKYDEAIPYANKVLVKSVLKLAPLYSTSITPPITADKVTNTGFAKIFNEGKNEESIFELSYSVDDGSDQTALLSFYIGTANSLVAIRPVYAESFVDEDWRKAASFNNSLRVIKYSLGGFNRATDSRNIVLMRLADIYLLKAEALVNIASPTEDNKKEAMELVNTIRKRAGGDILVINYDTNSDGIVDFSVDEIQKIVLDERKLELAFEGHRYFDLVRCGKVIEIMNPLNGQEDPRSFVWPIHFSELVRGHGMIEQNEYYK